MGKIITFTEEMYDELHINCEEYPIMQGNQYIAMRATSVYGRDEDGKKAYLGAIPMVEYTYERNDWAIMTYGAYVLGDFVEDEDFGDFVEMCKECAVLQFFENLRNEVYDYSEERRVPNTIEIDDKTYPVTGLQKDGNSYQIFYDDGEKEEEEEISDD